MSELMNKLGTLSAAEEFFDILEVPYERSVVHVNRLHILKRFNQYLRRDEVDAMTDEAAQREKCRALLTAAYEDFVRSTPAKEKVFKVFQDQDGQSVSLQSLKATLPSKNQGV